MSHHQARGEPADKDFAYPYCNDVYSKYDVIFKIGQGTFGEVFKASSKVCTCHVENCYNTDLSQHGPRTLAFELYSSCDQPIWICPMINYHD